MQDLISLNASCSEALASSVHFILFLFFSLDFHKKWHSLMSTRLITEVKQQWATLVLR